MMSHAVGYRLFAKWRHGCHLRSMTSYPKSGSTSIDVYSRKEKFCQISSRLDLKVFC